MQANIMPDRDRSIEHEPKLTYTIELLADHPQHVEQIARWCNAEWPSYYDNGNLSAALDYHSATCCRTQVPLGLVAVEKERLLGTVSLIEDDMSVRPMYNPWLGCVYVDPSCRGRGVAGKLIDAATDWAQKLNLPHLYAWTKVLNSCFINRGWVAIEAVEFLGEQVTVFKKVL